MIVGALRAVRYNEYGFLPPPTRMFHGSHVLSVSVTFEVTVGASCGGDAIQDVSDPARETSIVPAEPIRSTDHGRTRDCIDMCVHSAVVALRVNDRKHEVRTCK